MLPDFRVRQRDYLLEISRALTQELDLEKLLTRILKIAIEMLAGQAGLIALKDEGWRVAAAHGIASQFLSYLTPLLADENVRELNVNELNRMLKELTCAGAGSARARLRARPLLVQREGRPLRGLPGRRRDPGRDALPAGRLRHLRCVQGQALRPRNA